MLGITYETAKEKNMIRFPHHSDPYDLFFIENGQDIVLHDAFTVRRGFSPTDHRVTCEAYHNDPMHFYYGGNVYHIHEFAEVMARNGHTYEPAQPIQDLSVFDTKYLDRDLLGEDGKPIPYRVLWCNNGAFLHGEGWFEREMPQEERLAICICTDAAPSRQVCFLDGKHQKEFMSYAELFNRMENIPMQGFERRQIEHFAQERTRQNKPTSLAEVIKDAQERADVSAQRDSGKTAHLEH